MNEGIRKIGNIGTVDIYYDQYIEKNNFFIGWRSTPTQEEGMILVSDQDMKYEGVPLPDVDRKSVV